MPGTEESHDEVALWAWTDGWALDSTILMFGNGGFVTRFGKPAVGRGA